MLAQQPGMTLYAACSADMQHESASLRGYAHLVTPAITGGGVPAAKRLGLLRTVVHLPYIGAVVIEIGVGPLRWQGLDQLVLGGCNAFNGFEGFQVLRSHRGNDADGGMYQPAHLLDVPHMPRAHFPHKHLMGGRELLPDGTGSRPWAY